MERGDTFSPDALNENAQKVEQELTRLDGADAALEARADGLEGRVTALEVQKIFFGEVVAEGHDATVDLGVTPKAVLFFDRCLGGASVLVVGDGHLYLNRDKTYALMQIVENGFFVRYISNGSFFYSGRYNYIAFA